MDMGFHKSLTLGYRQQAKQKPKELQDDEMQTADCTLSPLYNEIGNQDAVSWL